MFSLFTHMQSLPIRYFDTHAHGDIMSVYTNDIDTLRQMISQSIPQLFLQYYHDCQRVLQYVDSQYSADSGNRGYGGCHAVFFQKAHETFGPVFY